MTRRGLSGAPFPGTRGAPLPGIVGALTALGALLPLGGCLDRVLESPYVLATGLTQARSVSPGQHGDMLTASSTGVYSIDGAGVATQIAPGPADAVTAHPNHVYVLGGGRVSWEGGGIDAPDVVDILAGFTTLLVLAPTHLDTVDIATGTRAPFATGFTGARAVALGPAGAYLVVSADTLWSIDPAGVPSPLATGLVDARAAAIDRQERVYVIQGDPEELWRVDGGTLTRIARWLEDPRDLHFGVGGLFPIENAYVASGDGTLDYVRPPP